MTKVVLIAMLAVWMPVFPLILNDDALADQRKGKKAGTESPLSEEPTAEARSASPPSEKLSVTHHALSLDGETISYSATAGYLYLKDDKGEARAKVFYVAYVRDQQDPLKRPVSFAFNGGPGAASVWLHLGALGPRRVPTPDPDKPEPPPYRVVDNSGSWLKFTDLVFIDPVGTGYSRALGTGKEGNQFYGIREDMESVGEVIRLYATRNGRWLSPKFLIGESYGTFRAVGLAQHLFERYGMDFNGLVLISVALSFQTLSFGLGNDVGYFSFLPSYTASAWYHKKLPSDLQQLSLEEVLREVEDWVRREYVVGLARGDSLGDEERRKLVQSLVRYTGLPAAYIENHNLRVERSEFLNELLREEGLVLGLMDSTALGRGEFREIVNEPGLTVTVGPYVAVMNHYLREQLKFETDLPYVFLASEAFSQWNWGSAIRGHVDITETLKTAISRSEHLKIFVASGYYDLDTPYFGAWYIMNHLGLPASLRNNLTLCNYESGHQLYTHERVFKKMTGDVAAFYGKAVPAQ